MQVPLDYVPPDESKVDFAFTPAPTDATSGAPAMLSERQNPLISQRLEGMQKPA